MTNLPAVYLVITAHRYPTDDWDKFVTTAVVGAVIALEHVADFAHEYAKDIVPGKVLNISDVFEHEEGHQYVIVTWRSKATLPESTTLFLAHNRPVIAFAPPPPEPVKSDSDLGDTW